MENNMDKNALIFGASGFAGRYLAQELRVHGYRLFGSDVIENENASLFETFSVCDLLDAEQVKTLIDQVKPSHIFNLAAISSVGLSWKIPQKTIEVNVVGGLNILEAVKDVVPQARVLLIGSSEEYVVSDQPVTEDTSLDANNPYGISKLCLEMMSGIYRQRYGIRVYHVRAFNHTGPGQRDSFVIPSWCRQAAQISCGTQPGTMRVGNVDVIRDLSDVRDIVRAYRMVIESEDCAAVYNIGSGKGTALKDILTYLQSLSRQPITIEQDPALLRPADNPVIVCDHQLITDTLGWTPEYDILDTVAEMFHYYEKDMSE